MTKRGIRSFHFASKFTCCSIGFVRSRETGSTNNLDNFLEARELSNREFLPGREKGRELRKGVGGSRTLFRAWNESFRNELRACIADVTIMHDGLVMLYTHIGTRSRSEHEFTRDGDRNDRHVGRMKLRRKVIPTKRKRYVSYQIGAHRFIHRTDNAATV